MPRSRVVWQSFPVVVALTLICVWLADRPFALWCNTHVSAYQYDLLASVTEVGEAHWWFEFWGAAVAVSVAAALASRVGTEARARWMQRFRGSGFVFLSLCAGGLVGVALKWIVGRTRPALFIDDGIYTVSPFSLDWEWATRSFPSGHAQAMFSLVTPLMLLAPRWRLPLLLLGGGVAATRALMTVHYLSDVLAGAYIGIAMAYAIAGVLERRLGPLRIGGLVTAASSK